MTSTMIAPCARSFPYALHLGLFQFRIGLMIIRSIRFIDLLIHVFQYLHSALWLVCELYWFRFSSPLLDFPWPLIIPFRIPSLVVLCRRIYLVSKTHSCRTPAIDDYCHADCVILCNLVRASVAVAFAPESLCAKLRLASLPNISSNLQNDCSVSCYGKWLRNSLLFLFRKTRFRIDCMHGRRDRSYWWPWWHDTRGSRRRGAWSRHPSMEAKELLAGSGRQWRKENFKHHCWCIFLLYSLWWGGCWNESERIHSRSKWNDDVIVGVIGVTVPRVEDATLSCRCDSSLIPENTFLAHSYFCVALNNLCKIAS